MDFEVRTLTTVEEFRTHERLQREIWGSDAIDVPANLLAAGARYGAVLLGAYKGSEMVGILYGFPALTRGRMHHHSHMLGVLTEHRRSGIGLALKMRQREIVRSQGLEMITWTVDPLEVGNNLFNFGRLGVTCDTYLVNAYGEMDDALNQGLPSDRFEVSWWVGEGVGPLSGASRDISFEIQKETPCLVRLERDDRELPVPRLQGQSDAEVLLSDAEVLLMEAPLEYRKVRAADVGLALEWRLRLREVFQGALGRGYVVVACVERGGAGCYVLRRVGGASAGGWDQQSR
ncbi:MAG: hypothetical protein M3Q29_04480 [Chloroflexota bacterium]|nr:hypothetical protein [Chloroflexota bacterium]